jgi:hypothetical protein
MTIPQGTDTRPEHRTRGSTRRDAVSARVSCGRARDLSGVTGTRLLPGGHYVSIVIARTYGRPDSGAAA